MKKASWILAAVGMTAFVSQAVAQEKAPAPMPAPKGTVIVQPAPAHGYATPTYNYQPECCDHGRSKGGWAAGVEVLILKPHFDHGNDENNGFENDGDEEPAGQMENVWSYSFSPRVWVSCTNCNGTGARIRYWRFDDDADELRTGADQPGNQLTANLSLDVVDLEVLQVASVGDFTLTMSGGLRIASNEITRQRIGEDDEVFQSLMEFRGYGATIAIEASSGSGEGLSFFGGTRASILFGRTELAANIVDPEGEAFVGSMDEVDDLVWVLELSLGAQYTCCWGDCLVSLRGAAEAQIWGGASFDGYAFPGGFPDPRPPFNAVTARNTADGNLGFGGLSIGLSFSR